MNDLPWFWEIQRSGSGPHYYLILEFAANEAELKQWIEPLLSVDYEFDDSLRIWVHKSSGACCYTGVEIQSNQVEITRSWGNDTASDDEFISPLLSSSSSNFVRWRVIGGGDSYTPQFFRSGTTVASFFKYCCAEVQKPSFSKVLQQLKASFSESGLSQKYAVGRPKFKQGIIEVPVFHKLPCVNPYENDLTPIAREVSDKCDVPARVSSAPLQAPGSFDKIFHLEIAGVFYFGY